MPSKSQKPSQAQAPHRAIAAALLCAALSCCTSPRVEPAPPAAAAPASAPHAASSPAIAPRTSPLIAATSPAAPEGYHLVWSDEFNKDGPLDPKDWTYEQGFVRNQELQWYQPDNAHCENGLLIIEARREKKPNPRFTPGSTNWQTSRAEADYTSASVTTRGLHSWLYGRFEARIKIDSRPGSWPAFWTLGARGGWPAGGEVDIMEYYANTLLANAAWAGPAGAAQWNTQKTPLRTLGPNWPAEFHTWQMDWDENHIALSEDGKLLNQTDLTKTLNRGQPNDNPFHRPMYLIFNQAIGANGGDPSRTEFPVRLEVDYVRVYQKN